MGDGALHGSFAPGCDIPGLHELLTSGAANGGNGAQHAGGQKSQQMLTPAQQEMLFNLAMAQSQSAGGLGGYGDGAPPPTSNSNAMPSIHSSDSGYEPHAMQGAAGHFAQPARLQQQQASYNFAPS